MASGRRMGDQAYLYCYQMLVYRDGEKCQVCDRTLGDRTTREERRQGQPPRLEKLEIDHIDGDTSNGDDSNLRLLCKTCNLEAESSRKSARDAVVERYQSEGNPSTRVAKSIVEYRQGDPTMQANAIFELRFRSYVLGEVRKKGIFSRTEAIASGAEIAGCSTSTAQRYLTKLTSRAGPLAQTTDGLGEVQLSLRTKVPRGI